MRATTRKILPGAIVLALLLATLAFLARPRTITGNPTGPVPFEFPSELGPFRGENVFFCQNEQCAASFPETSLTNAVCPACAGDLSIVSLGENAYLPTKTPVFRKLYHREGHADVTATLVFSGLERRSIHRPQVCLVAQGYRITDEYVYQARTGVERTMPIRILEISRPVRNEEGKQIGIVSGVYCYWLFNPEHETTRHLERFLHMLVDNGFRDYRPRWGYASLMILRDPGKPDEWKSLLNSFMPHFYPLVTKVRNDLDAQRNMTTILSGTSAEANREHDAGDGPSTEIRHVDQIKGIHTGRNGEVFEESDISTPSEP